MKIIIGHNAYREPGGEDRVFECEARLLRENGHEVIELRESNVRVQQLSRVSLARKTIWNTEAEDRVERLCREHRPDLIHFHNTFPLLSPAVYSAAKRNDVAVVQTLHNYRLICPAATLWRNNQNCFSCIRSTLPHKAILHGCYQGSRVRTSGVVACHSYHRIRRTYHREVDQFILLSDSMRDLFLKAGFDAQKMSVKPNFVSRDPGFNEDSIRNAITYVGRFSPEKGIDVLLSAWKEVKTDRRLRLIGDGPMKEQVKLAAEADERIEVIPWQSQSDLMKLLDEAFVAVVPSVWLEPFGLTAIEALAKGVPVVASRTGTLQEIVEHGDNGWTVENGNVKAWSRRLQECCDDPQIVNIRRHRARESYEARFSAAKNYNRLLQIYNKALSTS